MRDAFYVGSFGGERRGHWCLLLWQRDAHVSHFQSLKAKSQLVAYVHKPLHLYRRSKGKLWCQPDFTYLPSKKGVSLEEVSLGYLPKEEGTPEPSSTLAHSNHWIFCGFDRNLPKSLVSVYYVHDNDSHCKNFWEILATHWQPLTPQSLAPSPHMPTK